MATAGQPQPERVTGDPVQVVAPKMETHHPAMGPPSRDSVRPTSLPKHLQPQKVT